MTAQALKNTTTIQDKTEQTTINALFSELDRFKARTLKVTIMSVILFSALVGCAIMAWQSYQGLLLGIDIANIAIDIPKQVLEMEFESKSSSYSSSNGVKSLGDNLANAEQAIYIMTKAIMPIMGTMVFIMMMFAGIQLINARIEFGEFISKIFLCLMIFSFTIIGSNLLGVFDESGSSSKYLSKKEIISQLQSDDYNDFQQALSYIKSRNADLAKYLEIQHRAKKDLKISDEDKYFIENKITGKEFDNIPNSSAYLFSQVLSNQYLLDMANTYKKEYYQEQKRQLIQYVIFSSILSFVFIAGILANYTMRKRLKRIDFATKSMLRMA
ncbi:hypothetical protein LP087_13685 (plasmid) [Moraxella bovis]|uniref:hypothetical protein n=1 Tax=Moraxella bovis TaxID=476 RepID=UPI0022274AC2|nr:hypothetical protein [Moraxella bovis]UZA34047.1 hypothetical protein LP087_13685 [Moraxella bovis]UZA49964.1 hypothetical protein LP100_14085 [Moraxella bovis]